MFIALRKENAYIIIIISIIFFLFIAVHCVIHYSVDSVDFVVFYSISGSVAEWLGRWTGDQKVEGSNPGLSAIECNPGQDVNTHVPLSPSSIIWYQPMGGDALRLGR